MNRKESEFLAKKLFVELVYNCAYMEGVDMTLPQTQTLLDGGTIHAEHGERFNTALLHYYNTEDDQGLKTVLRECIKTLDTLNTSDGSTGVFNKAISYKEDYK